MTTIEISARPIETVESARVRFSPLAALARLWKALARQVEERQTLHRLYQLDAHILRDMGFDPDAIYRAHEGAIGDLSALQRNKP